MSASATIHASAVRVGDDGVLIRGASGSGKSALVLQLVFRHPAATLLIVAENDDATRLYQRLGFTVDLLGEATVGEAEADAYAARYRDLIAGLAERTRDWKPRSPRK